MSWGRSLIVFLGIGFGLNAFGFSSEPGKKTCKPSKLKKLLSQKEQTFEHLLKIHSFYSCSPQEVALYFHNKNHTWVVKDLASKLLPKDLDPQVKLFLQTFFYPYLSRPSDQEKNLLSRIQLKAQMQVPATQEQLLLYQKHPSYQPARQDQPDLEVIRDFKRRGKNKKALSLLQNLYLKNPKNLSVHRLLIQTQKNIKRDSTYLFYSQRYVDLIYKELKRKKNNFYKNLYLKEGLKNIRRIWTYSSTHKALNKLSQLTSKHCHVDKKCTEHYWIKGRILTELGRKSEAHTWLHKTMMHTSSNSKEYMNRLWDLVNLERSLFSKEKALLTAQKFTQGTPSSKVSSKLYYWMSQWTNSPQLKKHFQKLISQHHPLSFYFWSPLALGAKFKLKKVSFKKLKSNLSHAHEKNLLALIKYKEPSLTRSYIHHFERLKQHPRSLNWKKLKALSGQYADLLIELESGRLSKEENLAYFFSTDYEDQIRAASKKFKIPKELIWSIIRQESNFNSYARSWADAFGLMQILPKRAKSYLEDMSSPRKPSTIYNFNPYDLFEPSFNIHVGAWLLNKNLQLFKGNAPMAISAYNASEHKVKEWKRRFYKPGQDLDWIENITYRETRKYVKLVLRNQEIYKTL